MIAMAATKTNERPGTRAQVRFVRMSAYKAREVLNQIRGLPVHNAEEVLELMERAASEPISKLLASAVANAEHNDHLETDDLYIAACYADEGPTLRRWRPRARGRATRIRKRTCHITVILSPMPAEMAAKVTAERAGGRTGGSARRRADEARRARVARSRQAQGEPEETEEPEAGEPDEEAAEDAAAVDEPDTDAADEAPETEDVAADEASAEADSDEASEPAEDEDDK